MKKLKEGERGWESERVGSKERKREIKAAKTAENRQKC